jgi:phosphopantetheinyl transferase
MSRTFLNVQAKIEFIASRFCLRLLASKYLSVSHSNIVLNKTVMGRPLIRKLKGRRDHSLNLNISLSHCARGIAIAFVRKSRIGVDIETHQHAPGSVAAVMRLMTDAERICDDTRQIWNSWTRKESLLKGLGCGLYGLRGIPSLEHQTNSVSAGGALWTVNSLSLTSDCSLACAVEGMGRRLRLFSFNSCATINRRF